MAMFDPAKAKTDNANRGIPSGEYLLAIKSFERKTSKAKKPYLHCRIVVIAGAAKKRSFFDNISLDTENSGAMFRLGILAEQCGVEQAFDLEKDADIHAALVGRPFKAKLSLKHENGYANNGIERYVTGDKVTQTERKVMEEWTIENAEQEDFDNTGGDRDGHGGDDDAPPPDDSDIPF